MPSTGIPTPFSGLNQWEISDKPRREDFNEDNKKIDASLEELSSGKASQDDFQQFATQTKVALAGKAGTQNMIFSATASYKDGVFELTGLPSDLPNVFTARFSAPARFTPGDKLLIGTDEFEIVTLTLDEPSFGAFVSGALVSINIDVDQNRAFLPTNSGTCSMAKHFHVYDLPPSRIAAQPTEWDFESYPGGDIDSILGIHTVDNESYLFANKAVYVYDHLSQKMSKYSHTIATSTDLTCAAYTLDRYVCFEGGYDSGTYSVAINIDTKRIQQIPTTNRPTCVIAGKDNSVYAFGGLASTIATYYHAGHIGSTQQIFTAKRGSAINSAWDASSVASMNAVTNGYYFTAPRSAAGYSDGTHIWFAVATPSSSTHPADHSRYCYHISNNTLERKVGLPAFCTANSTAIPYGFEYDGKYYAVHGRKVSAYRFSDNTVDSAIVIPDVPVDRPNLITVYKDVWMTFTAHGIYRLAFVPDGVSDDVGGVLEIYAGQQYRSEKTMAIKGKATLTPQWQTATDDIEIKLGEYNGHGKVYVKSV